VVAVTARARAFRGVRAPGRALDLAAAAGSGARWALAAVVALRGLAGLLLVAYGCWLAYEPAGFVVLGLGVLADRVADERRGRRPE
jgi:hypothetical protein